jgi:quercetin dioxygenase-like cupin family protein
MRTIEVDGVEHWLGHVKDFTKNASLVDFLPKDNRISMAWVRLEAGEQLDPHTHPVDSMILLCEGGAQTLGDVEKPMSAGDILLVPQGRPHGFIGDDPNGFWGLSLQFDSRGLYEEVADPWATFDLDSKPAPIEDESTVAQLFRKNEEYMERFDKHRLFALVNRGLLKSADARARFLDCFQVWSNYFQKMLFARAVTVQDPQAEELSWAHLIEELGHNRELAKGRPELRPVFDPVLEGACAWFPWKTALISDVEKVVLVHLVVEASATYFYKHIQPRMAKARSSDHFDHHKVADTQHVDMGYDFLRQLRIDSGQPLFEIQRQGWAMLSAVMGRIADLVVHHASVHLDEAQETLPMQHHQEEYRAAGA